MNLIKEIPSCESSLTNIVLATFILEVKIYSNLIEKSLDIYALQSIKQSGVEKLRVISGASL